MTTTEFNLVKVLLFAKTPTGDFQFLHRFVALVIDFEFDWDGLTVKVELWERRNYIFSLL